MLNTIRMNPGVNKAGFRIPLEQWRQSAVSARYGAPSGRRNAGSADWLEYDVP